ncbi:MAG: nucleotidyltransferase domain-containing protein [Prevotellaceae bacterium]|nr:nucleotidyltransferase domain-containing protein [Prevotellaceae bacterium]
MIISTQPIKKAWLFGSFSRGEEISNSDVDILVEFDRSRNAKGNAESDEQGRNVPKSASVADCPVVALKCL